MSVHSNKGHTNIRRSPTLHPLNASDFFFFFCWISSIVCLMKKFTIVNEICKAEESQLFFKPTESHMPFRTIYDLIQFLIFNKRKIAILNNNIWTIS